MDIDTLHRLEEIAAAANIDANETLRKAHEEGDIVPLITLPTNTYVHSLEQYMPGPMRFQGTFKTKDANSFLRYCAENMASRPYVFIDADNTAATAIFDLGSAQSPGWGEHKAILIAEASEAYVALRRVAMEPLSQEDFADWIFDWNHVIRDCKSEDGELSVSPAAAGIRRISIDKIKNIENEERDFKRESSTLESVEVSSAKGLLRSFSFCCEVISGISSSRIECTVKVDVNNKKKPFRIRLQQIELVKLEAIRTFEIYLANNEMLHGADVFIGSFSR